MVPLVIPIFISHQGCPHRCIFCDQHSITGQAGPGKQPVTPERVKGIIEEWLCRPVKEGKDGVQVAFYGGSFTGLPSQRQEELLHAARPYIKSGQVNSIRISTRPDYINGSTISLLQDNSVAIVELGIQSLDQEVLDASARGHSVKQAKNAVRLLKDSGFTVGIQLMCGLPGDNTIRLMETVRQTAGLEPDFVRIYPALVIKGSGLESMYRDGMYRPLSLKRAVALSSMMKGMLDQHGIRVVRIGLQPSEELADKVAAGPYHPAFGELVMSRNLFKKARKLLRQEAVKKKKCLSISAKDESAFRGPDNISLKRLSALGLLDNIELIFNKEQPRNTVLVY